MMTKDREFIDIKLVDIVRLIMFTAICALVFFGVHAVFEAIDAHGAMTCVEDTTRAVTDNSSGYAERWATCTFDTTPGTAVVAVPTTIMSVLNGADEPGSRRKFVYCFRTDPGGTGPTDNSDLQILDANSFVILSATGNGANVVDNTAHNTIIYPDGPTIGSTNFYPIGNGQSWTITVTNNAVNNSSFDLGFIMLSVAPPATP